MNKSLIILFLFIAGITLPTQGQKQGQELIDSLQTALKNYDSRRTELNKTGYDITDSSLVKILNSLSWELKKRSEYAKAKQNADDALGISKKIDFKAGSAKAYNIKGVIYFDQGNYSDALKNYFSSLKIREEIGDEKGIGASYNNIANIYSEQGNYADALKNYFISLKLFEKIGFKNGISVNHTNIGNIYSEQGNYPEALKNYFASLKISKEIGDKYGIANSYNATGNIYWKQGNYLDALKNYNAALKIREEIGDKNGIAGSYNNIGIIYYEQNNYPAALKNHHAALKIREEIGDKMGMANSYINIGGGNTNLKNFAEAKKYLDKGLFLSKEIGAKEQIKTTYAHLADLATATGNWKDAYQQHILSVLYRDSLINEESSKKLTQTAMQYKFDKKEAATKAEQEKKDAVQQAELQKQKVIRNSFIGGVAFLLILLFGIISRYRFKQKANKELVVAYDNLKATQQQLVQSEKKAAFGVMAARVAHEIQNPLNFVTNFSEFSKELAHDITNAKDDEEKQEAVNSLIANLEKINHHSKRADTIIKQLQEHQRAGTAIEFFEKEKS